MNIPTGKLTNKECSYLALGLIGAIIVISLPIFAICSTSNSPHEYKVGECYYKATMPGQIVSVYPEGVVIVFTDGDKGFRSNSEMKADYSKIPLVVCLDDTIGVN